jgi:hypothetical protein
MSIMIPEASLLEVD